MGGSEETSNADVCGETQIIVLGQLMKVLIYHCIRQWETRIAWRTNAEGKGERDFANLIEILSYDMIGDNRTSVSMRDFPVPEL
jgi:hypothetical protein